VENENTFFTTAFINNPMLNDIRIMLSPDDFAKADKILGDYYENLLNSVSKDYYLFTFSNTELLEILRKQDEWGDLDYQLAQNILKDRGKEVSQAELKYLKENRIEALSSPPKSQIELVLLGYAIILFGGFAFFFGLKLWAFWFPLATIFGALLSKTKKTLPTGEIIYFFNLNDRKHGNIIFVLGLSLCIVLIVLLPFGYIYLENNFY
jgi:hypothetical protein